MKENPNLIMFKYLNRTMHFSGKLFIILLFCGIGFSASAQVTTLDRVIAQIGGEIILLSDVEEQFALSNQQSGGNLDPSYRCNILQNVVVSKLLLNQSRLDSIAVGEGEIEAQMEARVQQILAYMGGSEEQFEEYYGQTIGETKEGFRVDLEEQLRVERMQATIVESASVTPNEVKEFFERIPKDSLPFFNAEVEIAEIVYTPKVNDQEAEKAKSRLTAIRQQIVDGADFAELASANSDDPGSARLGGDLGWQRRGIFVAEFEATAYNLEEGELSKVIRTEFGYHLMRLEGRRGNNIRVRHILIKPEITTQDLEIAQNKLDSVRNLIAIDSLSFSKAVRKYSSEDEQSYSNDGFMLNPKTGNSFFEIADLDPDVYFTIDTMDIGSISSPIEFQTPQGETKYRLVLLKSRSLPHQANLKQDYSKIRTAALEQKKGSYITEWVIQKFEDTYLEIEPSYKSCPNLAEIYELSGTND